VLGVEVGARHGLDGLDALVQAGRVLQRAPLPRGQRHDHDAPAVAGLEVVPERAVEVVAVLALVGRSQLCLRDPAEVPGDRERHVGQREPHDLSLAGARPMAVGGEQPGRGEAAHHEVPRGQHAVERHGEVPRPGRPREAGGGVDRVVDLARPVRVAGQRDHHEVVTVFPQRVVGEPAAGREVREEGARVRDERGDELAPALGAQIDGERALALVEAGPEQALAVGRERPALVVETAADLVEADDLGAHLGQRHAAQRRGDERRALDDLQPVEDALGVSHRSR
jgi:hypothetical protein